MNQHFLQSEAWQEFQTALGREVFRHSGDGWSYLAILERGTGHTRLYCPYGPTATNEASFEEAINSLIKLGRQHKVTFIRVEPTELSYADYLKNHRWKKVTYQQLQPEHSQILDLKQPTDQLIAQMSQPVRNIYRNYHKKDIKIHQSTNPEDIDILLTFVHQVAERTGIRPHSDDYFRQQAATLFPLNAARLWYATVNNTPIAAALIYYTDSTLYYAHAGASALSEHRKLNAGTALLASVIIDAQSRGLTTVDLYGIAPDGASPKHPWAGFTRFKQSFGGSGVTFGGAWDLPLRPLSYWLYRTYQSLR